MKKTVGIIAGSISGNKGSEAMIMAVVKCLQKRLPGLRFIIFTPYPKSDRLVAHKLPEAEIEDGSPFALVFKMFPAALLERFLRPVRIAATSLFRESRLLKKCDILIDVAGISFSDGREIYLPFNVLTIWPKLILGGDVVKISQACGPFNNRLNRFFARWILPRCRFLAARGKETAENLKSIGVDHYQQCPDVSFLLNECEDMNSLTDTAATYLDFGTKSRQLVGLCPSSIAYKSCLSCNVNYNDINAKFISNLVNKGYRVLLLPHSLRLGSNKLRNNDLPVIKRIMQQVGRNAEVACVSDELDSITLRKIIGKCDFFVGSRIHGMISALAMSVPVMVCGWGHKYFEILDAFELRDYAFDYRLLSLEMMENIFERLAENQQEIRDRIRTKLPDVIAGSRVQIEVIVDLLQNN